MIFIRGVEIMDTSFLVNNALIPFSTALAGSAGGRLLKPVADILDNWFYIKFGSKYDLERKKKDLYNEKQIELYEAELDRQKNIGKFKHEIVQKLEEIPEENITIPNRNILALIMEKADYFLDINELRSAYSQIIASTSNIEYKGIIHPKMIDTIQQLTEIDFKMIDLLLQSFGFTFSVYTYFMDSTLSSRTKIELETPFPDLLGFLEREELNVMYTDETVVRNNLKIKNNEYNQSFLMLKELGIIEQYVYGEKYKMSGFIFEIVEKNIKNRIKESSNFKKYYKKLLSFQPESEYNFELVCNQLTSYGKAIARALNPSLFFVYTFNLTLSESPSIVPVDSKIDLDFNEIY